MADETYTTMALQIYGLVEDVPTAASGNNMLALIDRARIDVQNFTGLTVGSPSISDRFKPAVMNWALSHVYATKAGAGGDREISIGDFSVSNRTNQSSVNATFYETQAKASCASLGRVSRYGRTW